MSEILDATEKRKEQQRARRKRLLATIQSVGVAPPWNPQVSAEEQLRRAFRLAMGMAFVKPITNTESVEAQATQILQSIFEWGQSNRNEVKGCSLVLRGRQIDVLIFRQIQEMTDTFEMEMSRLGVTLATAGVYATIRLIGLEAGEEPRGVRFSNGDPVMDILWAGH